MDISEVTYWCKQAIKYTQKMYSSQYEDLENQC